MMSKVIKEWSCLFGMLLNHEMTEFVFFPLVKVCSCSDCGVDSLKDFLANDTNFGFCWVD